MTTLHPNHNNVVKQKLQDREIVHFRIVLSFRPILQKLYTLKMGYRKISILSIFQKRSEKNRLCKTLYYTNSCLANAIVFQEHYSVSETLQIHSIERQENL